MKLSDFKRAVAQTGTVLDSDVMRSFFDVEIEQESDIDEVYSVMRQHRPYLLAKLEFLFNCSKRPE